MAIHGRPTSNKSPYGNLAGILSEAVRSSSYYEDVQNDKIKAEKLKGMSAENAQIKEQFDIDLSGITDPKIRQEYVSAKLKGANDQQLEMIKQQGKQGQIEQKQSFLERLFGGKKEPSEEGQISNAEKRMEKGFDPKNLTNADIAEANVIDPNLARLLQSQKDSAIQEEHEETKRKQKGFETDRKYHSEYSRKQEEEADKLRRSIPKKEMALTFARDAIETGNTKYFSPDKLADATGIDLFRTAKGVQLVTAGKENLLSNMSRTSARAQNLWFEQRLNSMFPKIGQSNEANLTVQEMLEGENELDKAYLNAFDRTSEEDEEKYGYVRKDAEKRARERIAPLEKAIMNRTSYRMKEIEEKEAGISELKKRIGKKVIKGSPLTLSMAKLYKDKYGEKALQMAEKDGYRIPTYEEFEQYQKRPNEMEAA